MSAAFNDLVIPFDMQRGGAALGLWRGADLVPHQFLDVSQGSDSVLVVILPDGSCYSLLEDSAVNDAGNEIITRVQFVASAGVPLASSRVQFEVEHHAPTLYVGVSADGVNEGPEVMGPVQPDSTTLETWAGTPTDDQDSANNAQQPYRSDYACRIPAGGRYLHQDTGMELSRRQRRTLTVRTKRRNQTATLEVCSIAGQISLHAATLAGVPLIQQTQPDT